MVKTIGVVPTKNAKHRCYSRWCASPLVSDTDWWCGASGLQDVGRVHDPSQLVQLCSTCASKYTTTCLICSYSCTYINLHLYHNRKHPTLCAAGVPLCVADGPVAVDPRAMVWIKLEPPVAKLEPPSDTDGQNYTNAMREWIINNGDISSYTVCMYIECIYKYKYICTYVYVYTYIYIYGHMYMYMYM